MAGNKPLTLDLIRASEEILNSIPPLKDLHNLVSPEYATSWKYIGSFLGLPKYLLNNIEHDNHQKAEDCCNEVWEQWLDMDATATWYKVTQAIDCTTLPIMDVVTPKVVSNVSDHMQKYYIKERYKVSEEDWPPYQPNHFTSVALIHHKEKHATVREVIAVGNAGHSMDMVLSDEYFMGCQSTKDIAEIFAPLKKSDTQSELPGFILIEGAPGIGKTILSKEIAFQWANKNLLIEKLLLFLIFLRDPYIKNINSLKEFIAYAMCSSLQNENVDLIVQYLESTSGNYVTIVLDGYDEISSEIKHNSFISKIINRKILKLCGLVVTSRPSASVVLHGSVDRRVEILGFTKEDRMKYINQSLKGYPYEITQLETYLENNPFINSLCYIPLNMTILMCIFKEVLNNENYTLPKNQTEINNQFICITISRFLRKKGTPLIIKSLSELPTPYKQHFKHLSKLAFEMLGKDQVVFNDNDMKEYSNWSDLGLLKVVKYSNYLKDTPVMSYNFLHFTLQEFLAAHYVTFSSTFKQISILKHHFWESRYLNSWVMYVGLTSGDSFALKHFLTGHKFIVQSILVKARCIANETVNDKVKCLFLFQCFLEARNDRKCQQVGNYLVDEKIDLSNTTLLPKDIHTLSFFLTRSTTKQWKLLDLSKCYMGDNSCDILANLLIGDDKTNMFIDKMNFSGNLLTSKSICTILKVVQYFNVKDLIVTNNIFDSETFFEGLFTNIIQQQSYNHETLLSIKTNKYSEKKTLVCAVNCKDLFAPQMQNYLGGTGGIFSLCLWNTSFEIDNLLMLLSNVNAYSCIEVNVYKQDILDSQMSKIQKALNEIAGEKNILESSPSLYVKISYILLSHRQILARNVYPSQIIEALRQNSSFSILILNLSTCVLSNKLLHAIGNVISRYFKEVRFIHLSDCNMEDEQCEYFCNTLFTRSSVVRHLKELNLSSNKLTNACISSIVRSLKYCAIEKLVVSQNGIQENAFKDAFRNISGEMALDDFSSGTPMVVVNNITNLHSKVKDTACFGCFADAYIFRCKSINTVSLCDCLSTLINNAFSYRAFILSSSSLLAKNFGIIISLLDGNSFQQVEVYDANLSDDVAIDCATKLNETHQCYASLNVKYILAADTKFLADKCAYQELNYFSLNLQSVSTLQLTSCNFTPKDIVDTLTSFNIFNGLNLINLSRCNIGDDGCSMLCSIFTNCRMKNDHSIFNIKELNLSYNFLTSVSIMYIVNLLQCCVVENLILSNNCINSNNFSEVFFKDRCNTYANYILNIPLLLINTESAGSRMNFTVYVVNKKAINNKLVSNLNSLTNTIGTMFLVNTNLQPDVFIKIISLLQIYKMLKVTIVEHNLKYGVASFAIKKLKLLLTEREINGYRNIQYFLLSKNNLWANDVKDNIITNILASTHKIKTITNDRLQLLIEVLQVFMYKHWETIDLSNCNIGDEGCEILVDHFASSKCTSSVKVFNLSNNKLSLKSAENISKLIVHTKLKMLVISHNELDERFVADALTKTCCISTMAMHSTAVQVLNNDHAALLTYKSSITLTDELFKCPHNITYFSMRDCYVTDDNDSKNTVDDYDDDDNDDDDDDNDDNVDINEQFLLNTKELNQDYICMKIESLTYFELSKCKIPGSGLFRMFSALEGTCLLQSLVLVSLEVTNNMANKLAGVIEKNLHLEILNLSSCSFPECGFNSILCAVNRLLSLKYFNLSNSKCKQLLCTSKEHSHGFTEQTLSFSLLQFIISKNKSLGCLNIANCEIKEDELIGIMHNLSSVESINCLDISGNRITDGVANRVALAIRRNSSLKYLNASDCSISEYGLFMMFNALSDLGGLEHMDISLNRISNIAAEEITNVILHNTQLSHLSFRQCELYEEDFMKIMLSLTKQNTFKHLDLSHNKMNSNIASMLAVIIRDNATLEYLDVSRCNILEQDITDIAGCLKIHARLKYLNIGQNYISHSSAKYITSAVSCNEALEYLDLSDCGFLDFRIIDIWLSNNAMLKNLNLNSNTLFQAHRNSLTLNGTSTEEADNINNPIPLYIEHLDMSNCRLSGLQLTSIAKHLQLASRCTLKHLDISCNRISNKAAIEIASLISCNLFLENVILSNCDLSRSEFVTIAKALQNLSRIKHLDISHNALTSTFNGEDEIASIIDCNSCLENLNLSNCQLSELQIISIAKAFSKASQLLYFDISHNEISQNASGMASIIINSTSLKHFNVSGCNLQDTAFKIITNSLANITSLISIDMSCNNITDKTAQSIGIALSKNVSLEQLNLCACFMNNNSSALMIFDSIKEHNEITHLSLRSNLISDEVAKLISTILNSNNIISIDLGYCSLQKCGFTKILNGLANTTTLQHLNLEYNNITEELAIIIASIVRTNISIRDLNFSNCNLSESGMQSIFYAINSISSLNCLNISGNEISDCSLGVLKDALCKNHKMRYLDFSGCKINEIGIYNVLMSLTSFKYLKYLNLQSCSISDQSAIELLPIVIASNKSLNYLDLTDCKLQEKGIMAIAKKLQTSLMLNSLSLSSNIITNATACDIALVVSKNTLLQHLALSNCGLKEEGLINISEALCTISSLKHLDLSYNIITDIAADTLVMGVVNNTSLQYLNLRCCKWPNTGGITAICKVIDQIRMIKIIHN